MENLFSGNKKGNAIGDTIFLVVILFAFVLVSIIGYAVFQQITPQMRQNIEVNSTADVILTNSYSRYPAIFDNLALFLFLLLWIGGIIASYMIDSHPIFAGLTFILLIAVIISSIYISNYYESVTTSTETMQSAASQFVKTNFIMQHLLEETIVIAGSVAFVLYAKLR